MLRFCLKSYKPISNGRMIYILLIWPQGYKSFFMLNSAEHEILNARKVQQYQEIQPFPGSDKPILLFFLLINVTMLTLLAF